MSGCRASQGLGCRIAAASPAPGLGAAMAVCLSQGVAPSTPTTPRIPTRAALCGGRHRRTSGPCKAGSTLSHTASSGPAQSSPSPSYKPTLDHSYTVQRPPAIPHWPCHCRLSHPAALHPRLLKQAPVVVAHHLTGKGLVLQHQPAARHLQQDASPQPQHLPDQGDEAELDKRSGRATLGMLLLRRVQARSTNA